LESWAWDLLWVSRAAMGTVAQHRMEDIDIRELAGTEGTCGLSDLDTLTLGRDDAVDGGLCLASGWESVGCGIDCLSAVDRAGEEWLTFRHGGYVVY
jgi:hypothetical protein